MATQCELVQLRVLLHLVGAVLLPQFVQRTGQLYLVLTIFRVQGDPVSGRRRRGPILRHRRWPGAEQFASAQIFHTANGD